MRKTEKNRETPEWDWQKPLSELKVLQQIEKFVEGNINYRKDLIMGFPGTNPELISTTVYSQYLDQHANNIGLHTMDKDSEVGFQGTQEAERQVIAMAADLMDASLDEIDGYISSGGTEANIAGCWIGRNAQNGGPTAIVCSFLTHYSILKAANLLGISQEAQPDGQGLHLLGADEDGHILLKRLHQKIFDLASKGIANIIVVGNAGTVMLGSVDDIPAMSEIIERMKGIFPHINIHFHVDAAIGGFIVPFVKELPDIGFNNSAVDSISMDGHKTGLTPYGSGIIMARKGLFERIKSIAPYVPGNDYTLCGSRAGAMALSCWAVMRKLGKDGYALKAKRLIVLTDYIQERLKELGISTFDSDTNIVGVKQQLSCEKIIAHNQKNFPADMAKPLSSGTRPIWNITVMEHTNKKLVDWCMAELAGLA